MKVEMIPAPENSPLARIYVPCITLANFRGHRNVEAHLFRVNANIAEMDGISGMDLVSPPDPAIPEAILAGATKEAALSCLLEAFTLAESEQIVIFLRNKFAEQTEKIIIAPLELPIPFGMGPLAGLPATAKSGFIYFDEDPDFTLPFKFRAYYELP